MQSTSIWTWLGVGPGQRCASDRWEAFSSYQSAACDRSLCTPSTVTPTIFINIRQITYNQHTHSHYFYTKASWNFNPKDWICKKKCNIFFNVAKMNILWSIVYAINQLVFWGGGWEIAQRKDKVSPIFFELKMLPKPQLLWFYRTPLLNQFAYFFVPLKLHLFLLRFFQTVPWAYAWTWGGGSPRHSLRESNGR